jgi:predicted lipoprotein
MLAILRPWTVRPLFTAAPVFDAVKFANDAWPRIVAEASGSALDLPAARRRATTPAGAAPARRSAFVRVTGTLTTIDRHSRVGLALVRVAAGEEREVAIQIGPVIRGTALRDATSFVRFDDFSNQFEFAAVSNALHERVLRDVIGALDLDALKGRSITVLGAATLHSSATAEAPIEVVPIQVQPAGGAR